MAASIDAAVWEMRSPMRSISSRSGAIAFMPPCNMTFSAAPRSPQRPDSEEERRVSRPATDRGSQQTLERYWACSMRYAESGVNDGEFIVNKKTRIVRPSPWVQTGYTGDKEDR